MPRRSGIGRETGTRRSTAPSRPRRATRRGRTDYELTALGRSLLPVMQAIKGWAETYIE
ncbi:winged helix-turn-helix transcriptional regulator, partial [Nocardia sp. NPDC004722]